MTMLRWTIFGVLASVLLFSTCQDATGPDGQGQIQVLITDAPVDYLEKAEVWISRVYLQGGSEEEAEEEEQAGGRVGLFNDPDNPRYYDLLTLQNGVTDDLTPPTDLEAGAYAQLRLVVDHALVTLKDGYVFRDGGVEKDLFVPSGMQSGIKVLLNAPIEIADGILTIVTVDFDVNDNFVLQGNPETPAGILGILFTPTLREKDRTEGVSGG
jgi:hypothetical protein